MQQNPRELYGGLIGVLLGSYWGLIGVLLGSYWGLIGVLLGSYLFFHWPYGPWQTICV